jgi:hypothetical protein
VNRYLYCDVSQEPFAVATAVRADDRPRVQPDGQHMMVWTNDDLENLHIPGLISIVDRIEEERPTSTPAREPYVEDLARRHDISRACSAANDITGCG